MSVSTFRIRVIVRLFQYPTKRLSKSSLPSILVTDFDGLLGELQRHYDVSLK